MTTERYIYWIALTIFWFAALSAAQYPIRKRNLLPLRVILIFVKFFLGIIVAFFLIAVDVRIIYLFGYALAPLYIALIADSVGDILTLPIVIKKRKEKPNHNRMQIIVCAVCTVIYLIIGTVNMQTVTANRVDYTSDKLTQTHKVVFASDLHVGSSQSMNTVESTIRKIDEENADLVLLGGDIVDEYTTKEEMEKVFSLLGEIKAPVYFIYGNHDTQPNAEMVGGATFTQAELEAAIHSNGITIVKDEFVGISDDLTVLGREDISVADRKPTGELPERPENTFVLSVDHSPYNEEDIIETKADLQLSGHTHAGQLFPLRLTYRLAGNETCGFYRFGDTDVYVSSGASGWCIPFRTEAGCRYEVITLEPKI